MRYLKGPRLLPTWVDAQDLYILKLYWTTYEDLRLHPYHQHMIAFVT